MVVSVLRASDKKTLFPLSVNFLTVISKRFVEKEREKKINSKLFSLASFAFFSFAISTESSATRKNNPNSH